MPIQMVTNVPVDRVATLTQMHRNLGATSVTAVPENDGEFTLIVVYPDRASAVASLNQHIAGAGAGG